ncbi:MAG: ribonuclease D, partial [Actinobacteria bacterium]|nr:ribonuclease D [Actinomycetota bacterium]
TLAAVRELWTTRDELAAKRDVAPSRVLPDSAIVAAATADPKSSRELEQLPVFGGPRQRRSSRLWASALTRARALPTAELPSMAASFDGPPPVNRWARRDPDAASRLADVRAAMTELSESVSVPVENLLMPDLLRRLVWDWQTPDDDGVDPGEMIDARLTEGGARPWQRSLVVPVLTKALHPSQVTDG